MKIGIVSNVDNFYKVSEGEGYNYIKFIADSFSKNHEIVLFDWRNVSEELYASKGLIGKNGSYSAFENLNLNECDVLFVKQLGKIHQEPKKFMAFLDYLESFKGKVLNPVETMRENLSKEYLLTMQKDGFPVIPTAKLESDATLEFVKNIKFSPGNYEGLVVKPHSFGESGQGVRLLDSFKDEAEFREYLKNNYPVIVQPVIPEIFTHGEYSLVFVGKEFSHAIHKHTGEFKINYKPGSTYEEYAPTEEELALARKILDYWPSEIGYSRIDLMKHKNKPLISEVEMVNPNFYMEDLPGVGERLVEKLESFLVMKHKDNPLSSEVEIINTNFYMQDLPGVGEELVEKLESFLVMKNE